MCGCTARRIEGVQALKRGCPGMCCLFWRRGVEAAGDRGGGRVEQPDDGGGHGPVSEGVPGRLEGHLPARHHRAERGTLDETRHCIKPCYNDPHLAGTCMSVLQ